MRSYEDLTFYQDMYALCLELYSALPGLPTDERFALAHQIRTSAISVLSNIAEGSGRGTDGEYANSASNACGSAAELDCQLKLTRDLKYLPAAQVIGWLERLDSIRRRLRRFYETLKASSQQPRRPSALPKPSFKPKPSQSPKPKAQSPTKSTARPRPSRAPDDPLRS